MLDVGVIDSLGLTTVLSKHLNQIEPKYRSIIVDEAQNLTPHEIKTVITRAGENTKIIFTGDVNQIDHPYLDIKSNGLTYLVERMKGQNIFGHITLNKGERSELSEIASELL